MAKTVNEPKKVWQLVKEQEEAAEKSIDSYKALVSNLEDSFYSMSKLASTRATEVSVYFWLFIISCFMHIVTGILYFGVLG